MTHCWKPVLSKARVISETSSRFTEVLRTTGQILLRAVNNTSLAEHVSTFVSAYFGVYCYLRLGKVDSICVGKVLGCSPCASGDTCRLRPLQSGRVSGWASRRCNTALATSSWREKSALYSTAWSSVSCIRSWLLWRSNTSGQSVFEAFTWNGASGESWMFSYFIIISLREIQHSFRFSYRPKLFRFNACF